VGDIVVVTSKCYSNCSLCQKHLGDTALVTETFTYNLVTLQFRKTKLKRRDYSDSAIRGGFHGANLHFTGLSVPRRHI